ncbi:sulfotransferase [Alteromonas sp. 14N.309.X.WAT.G.H12]|uniref:sulfotransferase n=1 Tax=Alteromonas sp. 14N.309.X.WAT.G.H12 TaxID=3120824 RepID=UPI002FCF89C7
MSYSPQMLRPLDLSAKQGASPSFIGLGTPKAGTSWWYNLLLQHPQIAENNFGVKETCFYSHAWPDEETDEFLERYRKGFYSADSSILKGEWSPLYFSHPFALKRITNHFPDTRFLIIFRNPIDAFYSWINQLLRKRASRMIRQDEESKFMYLNYDAIPSIFSQIVRYPAILAELKEEYGSNILCLQYEENARNTQAQYNKTTDFLGIARHKLCDANIRVNAAKTNLVSEMKFPSVAITELKHSAEHLLTLCPDFDANLWSC